MGRHKSARLSVSETPMLNRGEGGSVYDSCGPERAQCPSKVLPSGGSSR